MTTKKEKQEQILEQAAEDGAKNHDNKHNKRGDVRSIEDAKKLILEHLEKDSRGILKEKELSASEVMGLLDPIVDELYKEYEENGTVPTLQALLEKISERSDYPAGLLPAIGNMDDPFTEPAKKNGKKIAIILFFALIVALSGITLAHYFYAEDEVEETVEVVEEEEEIVTATVDFEIEAENWAEDSSPFIAHVEGTTEDGVEIDFYHAIWAAEEDDATSIELEAGEYSITYISAINTDGSIYSVADVVSELVIESAEDEAEETVVEDAVDSTVETDTDEDEAVAEELVEETFTQIAAEDVTSEQLEEILEQIAEAVANGDETLTGDKGTSVVEVAAENAANNSNADTETIEEAAADATESVSSTASSTTSSSSTSSSSSSSNKSSSSSSSSKNSSSSSSSSSSGTSSSNSGTSSSSSGTSSSNSGTSSSSSGTSSSNSGTSSSNSGTSSSTGSSSSSSSSASSSTSTHTHSWTSTGQSYYVCNKCGEGFSDGTSMGDHLYQHVVNDGSSSGSSTKTKYTCSCGSTKYDW